MRSYATPALNSTSLLKLLFIPLLLAIPFSTVGQEEKALEKAAIQQKRQPPENAKPAEPKKPDHEKKPEDESKPKDPMSPPTFNGLKLRSIGPAFTSGRVVGIAVDPNKAARSFVAAASGGVRDTSPEGTN